MLNIKTATTHIHKEINMSNKNPFEIRTDVLAMAKDYMDKQYELNLEMARKMNEAMEGYKMPTMYTTEELMAKAREFYAFVSDKGDK